MAVLIVKALVTLFFLLTSLCASAFWATKLFLPDVHYELKQWSRGGIRINCPHPGMAPPHDQDKPSVIRNRCVDLPSNSTLFTMQACALERRSTCNSFAVLVRAIDQDRCVKSRAIKMPEEGEWLRNTIGPDVIKVFIDGAQRWAKGHPKIYSEQDCEWRYDVQLFTSGDFTLDVRHMYADFGGWTRGPIINQTLLAAPVPAKDLGDLACPANCPSYSVNQDLQLVPRPPISERELPACIWPGSTKTAELPDARLNGYRPWAIGCRLMKVDRWRLNWPESEVPELTMQGGGEF